MKMLDGRLRHWSNENIIKGFKFRFALSVHGFDFLCSSGYPLPAYSTIMNVETMNKTDKFGCYHMMKCALMNSWTMTKM